MDQTAARPSTRRPVVFRDGLGRRCRVPDQSGIERVEILLLRAELTASDQFEPALRERVARLASFQSPEFSRLKTVDRLRDQTSTLVLVSETIAGTRLADLLAIAEKRGFGLDGSAAWCLVRQLVSAIAALHEEVADVAHGAIAAERLIVTPDARLMVVEYALGSALKHVRLSHEQFWKDLRVACPRAAAAAPFDHRSDITQIGVVALSLLLGRALRDDEYPSQMAKLVESIAADGASTPEPLRAWLSRALQLKGRESFASAIEASAALDEALEQSPYSLQASDLDAFLARCQEATDSVRPSSGVAEGAPTDPATADPSEPATVTEPITPGVMTNAVAAPVPMPVTVTVATPPAVSNPPAPVVAIDAQPDKPTTRVISSHAFGSSNPALQFPSEAVASAASEEPAKAVPIEPLEKAERGEKISVSASNLFGSEQANKSAAGHGMWRRTAAAAALLTVISGAGWAAASHFFDVSAEHVADVPIASTATTPGAEFASAAASVAPVLGGDPAKAPPDAAMQADLVPTAADAAAASPAIVPTSAPASAWLDVSSPHDVQIFESGALIGSSGGRVTLAPGAHVIELVSEPLGYRSSRSVQVKNGETAAIKVEFPSGTIALNASPWAEVLIDGRNVGETPIGNLSISVGSHEVVFRHPELGEQRTVATVTLTAPTRLSVDMRKP